MEDDSSVNIMIVLSQASSVQFEVNINIINVNAIGMYVHKYLVVSFYIHVRFIVREDYNTSSITVNVSAGVTMQRYTLPIIIDNNIVECNRVVNVTMVSVITCGVTIGSDRTSEVIIRDDDGKYMFIIVFCYIRE